MFFICIFQREIIEISKSKVTVDNPKENDNTFNRKLSSNCWPVPLMVTMN